MAAKPTREHFAEVAREAAAVTLAPEKQEEAAYDDVFAPALGSLVANADLHAKANHAFGRERQEARRDLQTRRASARTKAARQQASSPEQFRARLSQIRGAALDTLERVEDSPWYASLSLEKREQVDDAITDAFVRGTGAEAEAYRQEPAEQPAGELLGPAGETDPNYEAYLDDESGFVPHPYGETDAIEDLDELAMQADYYDDDGEEPY